MALIKSGRELHETGNEAQIKNYVSQELERKHEVEKVDAPVARKPLS